MANRLTGLLASDRDKVNCPFYFKIGACKYMDKCQRRHIFPKLSETLMIPHLYSNSPIDSALANHSHVNDSDLERATNRFQQFYEDIFKEVSRHGQVDDMVVCANLSTQLVGNVYIKFVSDLDAERCMEKIKGRYYSDVLVQPEYSPVIDFSLAKCKQETEGTCARGGNCNYMHVKHVSASFKRILFQEMYKEHPEYSRRKTQRRRERSRDRSSSADSAKRRAKIEAWNQET